MMATKKEAVKPGAIYNQSDNGHFTIPLKSTKHEPNFYAFVLPVKGRERSEKKWLKS